MYYISSKYAKLQFINHKLMCPSVILALQVWHTDDSFQFCSITGSLWSLHLPLLSKCYLTPTTAMAIQGHTRQHPLLQQSGATHSVNSKNKDF